MPVQVHVVVHVPDEIGADAHVHLLLLLELLEGLRQDMRMGQVLRGGGGVQRVFDELAFAHFVLHVRTRQVGREQQQTEAEQVDGRYIDSTDTIHMYEVATLILYVHMFATRTRTRTRKW